MSGAHQKLVAETEFKIEKGVAFTASRPGKPRKYPFSQMEVGDSIFIPNGTTSGVGSGAAVSARGYAFRHNLTFRASTIDGGVRIWRTA